eukprot:gene2339-8635_t
MQGISLMRSAAFGGASVRPAMAQRSAMVSRSPVVVQAGVQDVKGTVVSTAMKHTIVVAVERLSLHPKYFKRVKSTKRYHAHDADDSCTVGDYVVLEGVRPISKLKKFTVAKVIRKAK